MSSIIYTKDYCPYCDMAKKLLEMKGVTFQELNISHADDPDSVLAEIRSLTTQKTFPQIVLEGQHIGGYTDLRAFYENKK